MNKIELLGYAAAILTTYSLVPQALAIIKTGGVKDISLGMYLILTIGLGLWFGYGIFIKDLPIILANGLSLLLSGFILVMKLVIKDKVEIKNTLQPKVRWLMDWSKTDELGNRLYPNKSLTEIMFEENLALSVLLKKDVVFINSHWYQYDWPEDAKLTISINVNCNDVFGWGCADAEPLLYEDLEDLYSYYEKDPILGAAVWCIKKRNKMPQKPVYDSIMEQGIWNLDEILKLTN